MSFFISRRPRFGLAALTAAVVAAAAPHTAWTAPQSPAAAASGSAPSLFLPGVVSTENSESHVTLAPDGRSLFFVKLTPDFAHWTVMVSNRAGDGWSKPEVAWFSGRWDDADVSFSPDGSTIYFISNRPDGEAGTARPDMDLFRIKRTPSGWGPAERIEELSSPGSEWFPNQASSGTLYFGSERRDGNLGPEGTADLWRARWLGDRFAEPENLGAAINTADQEIEPWIAADESSLVFAAKGRPGSLGSYDFYVSFRCRDEWTRPRPLIGGVNSPGWDFGGRFSPDGSKFYFGSNRPRESGNDLFDVYEIDASALGLGSPCGSPSPSPPPAAVVEWPASDEETVAALDTEYQAAVERNDAATMDRILADAFVLVLGNGTVQTKADLLREARDGKVTWEQQKEIESSQKVRVWGDTAVVTAKLWVKGSSEGKSFDRKLWFSDTYVRTKSGWRYVFGQASLPLPREP